MPPAARRRPARAVMAPKFRIATAPVPRCEIDAASTCSRHGRPHFPPLLRRRRFETMRSTTASKTR
ncbi:hypothetical protein UP09_14355 [Bradyrhizobium sp. LTSP885]|nr:hypothetical protein UP09_14355 [Bradyrhizobium sp. LTSP885]